MEIFVRGDGPEPLKKRANNDVWLGKRTKTDTMLSGVEVIIMIELTGDARGKVSGKVITREVAVISVAERAITVKGTVVH